ncbi:MAG TPA: hypothetical protein VK698_06085 [Kofleriaceae bacterium]|nr:hypothetical protein [Kofleriaceae bacterium]
MSKTHLLMVALAASTGLAGMAHAERLIDVSQVQRGSYYAPRFAPDGRDLLVTGPKLSGLYLVDGNGGAVRRLADDAGAGVAARWNRDGTVGFRAVRAGARRAMIVDRDGRVRSAPAEAAPIALAQNERIYVRDRAGELVPVGTGDRFFSPEPSPDGDRVVFQGLSTGLYIYTRSTGDLVQLGAGTAPSWSPDGSRLLFELTEDDGHEIVASDLYLYDVRARRTHRLTATSATVERRPSFAPDGRRIAFDDDTGGIYVGRLEEVR